MVDRQRQSLECVGWWEQDGLGRQTMKSLSICFDLSHFSGSGHDIIGPFRLTGRIERDGSVTIDKAYLGKHHVEYIGEYDGEGTFFGFWRLGPMSGRWLIRLMVQEHSDSQSIQEIS